MKQKAHITRIFGTNKDGDVLPDMWVDVERICVLSYRMETKETSYQNVNMYLNWHDDPDYPDYSPEQDAKVVRKICRPDEADLEDPEEWVPVRVISQVKFADADKTKQYTFAGSPFPDARRIVHYDTSIDDKARSWVDLEGRKAYVVAAADYEADKDSKDDGQYIEHQIINNYAANINEYTQSNGQDQKVRVYIEKRHPLIDDEADPAPDAKLEELGPEDLNPPYLLDPYQAIINVQLGGVVQDFLIGGVNLFVCSTDGKTFDLPPPPVASPGGYDSALITSAAYYGGVWVAATNEVKIYRSDDPEVFNWSAVFSSDHIHLSGNALVAAGKPKEAEQAVFVAAAPLDIDDDFTSVGVLVSNDKGITWSEVATYSNTKLLSLNFVNGQFFLGGARSDTDAFDAVGADGAVWVTLKAHPGFLAVSDDGQNWVTVPGLGIPLTIPPQELSGDPTRYAVPSVLGVAYDPKEERYVAVVQQPYSYPDPVSAIQTVSSHFSSYTSSNGRTWGDGNELSGSDAQFPIYFPTGQHSVAFGNGSFAAIGMSIKKYANDQFIRDDAQILSSADGSGWSATRITLPGEGGDNIPANVSIDWGAINYSKTARCFLAGGSGTHVFPPHGAVFSSEDGASWSSAYAPAGGFWGSTVNFIAVGRLPSSYR